MRTAQNSPRKVHLRKCPAKHWRRHHIASRDMALISRAFARLVLPFEIDSLPVIDEDLAKEDKVGFNRKPHIRIGRRSRPILDSVAAV